MLISPVHLVPLYYQLSIHLVKLQKDYPVMNTKHTYGQSITPSKDERTLHHRLRVYKVPNLSDQSF
jgi:hypothetical protein